MNAKTPNHQKLLIDIAKRAMIERGLRPEISAQALAELKKITANPQKNNAALRDQRDLLWSSIDNDDSLDLDQLTVAEALPGKQTRVLVAIADVDALVPRGSAIDENAQVNTTTIYTPSIIFSMLPEALSNDLTSFNFEQDRPALVVEMIIGPDGALAGSDVYQALVRNQAKLAYREVAAWLEDGARAPRSVAAVPGLAENLRLQDQAAQHMKHFRQATGALTFETIEPNPVMRDKQVVALDSQRKNRASEMIENFMITTNGITARFLSAHGSASIRRVVLAPKRWDRIVEIAKNFGTTLPQTPDSAALETFLLRQRTADPLRFPDLSLSIIKLMGSGEYAAELPTDTVPDHFGLAARDYAHSTAPNRRYTDLITHRLLKAAIQGRPSPYSMQELQALAKHCTEQEDDANKVERQVSKSAAALLLQNRVGEHFQAVVTGASPKGTWVRLVDLPVEGRLMSGIEGVDVGDRIGVRLTHVEVERGFIDFKKING